MVEVDPEVARLRDLLERCLTAFLERNPGYTREDYRPGPFGPEEAKGFLQALDSGVFELEPDGMCKPVGIRAAYCYPLIYVLDKKARHVTLWREWLTHARVAAELHRLYGYPRESIALEVEPFDLFVYSDSNVPLIAAEAKKSPQELRTMLDVMEKLSREDLPLECHPARRPSNPEKKFRGLLLLRPPIFAAIAPGVRQAYDVTYPAGRRTAVLERRDDIPQYGELT